MKPLTLVPITAALMGIAQPILACTIVPPPNMEPPVWIKPIQIGPNITTGTIYLQLNQQPGINSFTTGGVVGSNGIDECACAISFPSGFPASLNISEASFGRGNRDDIVDTFEEYMINTNERAFDFQRNPSFDDNFADANFPIVEGLPISPDSNNWFAFTDLDGVPAFTAQEPEGIEGFSLDTDNPYYFLAFDFEIDTSELPGEINGLPVQFAAGKLNNPNAPIRYTGSGNLQSEIIPEPSSELSLLALGTLGAALTLKRKLKSSKSSEKETTRVG